MLSPPAYLRGVISLNPERELLGFLLLGAWAGYIAYRLEYQRAPLWVYGYLVVKVLAAWAFGWLYSSYYCHGDTLKHYSTAGRLWYYLTHEPSTGIALLFRELSKDFEEVGWRVYYRDVGFYGYDYDYSPPVNYRFARLMMPVYAAVGGGYYGMQGLVGLLSGLLWYGAYRRWSRVIPMRGIWVVGFLFLPSALFWGSGLLRDSLGLPLMLYVGGWVASMGSWPSWREGLGLMAGAVTLGLIRAEALLLGVSVGIGYRLPWRSWWLWGGAIVLAWGALWWGAEKICGYRAFWLSPREHPELLEGAHVFLMDCVGGPLGSVWSWVQGAWYGLTGPYLWQARKGVVLLAAVEVLAVWFFLGWTLWRYGRRWRWSGKALFLVGVGVFIVGIAAMAMPFWGTVVRHRLYGWSLMWLGFVGLHEMAEEAESRLG